MPTRHILVVDDSPTDLQLAINALKKLNCRLSSAVSGEEALQRIQQDRPDVVVLDVIMAGQNGYQLCRQIKKDPTQSGIRVVLVTSKNQESDKFWGMKQGADAYVTKPYKDEDLVAAINN